MLLCSSPYNCSFLFFVVVLFLWREEDNNNKTIWIAGILNKKDFVLLLQTSFGRFSVCDNWLGNIRKLKKTIVCEIIWQQSKILA